MKYLILGSGGTGGSIGGFLHKAGKNVTFIARGAHLESMKQHGLRVKSGLKGDFRIQDGKYSSIEEFNEIVDVIFVCVKGYSIDGILPFLQKISDENTIIIPILNIYGTGEKLRKHLPNRKIMDGCIYIVSYVEVPGVIVQDGGIFKIVYGVNGKEVYDMDLRKQLNDIKEDLLESGIHVNLSDRIQSEAFEKYTFISTYATVGAYYDCVAKELQVPGEKRELFIKAQEEICQLAKRLGLELPDDMIERNVKILDKLTPNTTASMQKDLMKGGNSEMDGLLFEVIRMASEVGMKVPTFEMMGKHFGYSM